jgi:hypothetical protein
MGYIYGGTFGIHIALVRKNGLGLTFESGFPATTKRSQMIEREGRKLIKVLYVASSVPILCIMIMFRRS